MRKWLDGIWNDTKKEFEAWSFKNSIAMAISLVLRLRMISCLFLFLSCWRRLRYLICCIVCTACTRDLWALLRTSMGICCSPDRLVAHRLTLLLTGYVCCSLHMSVAHRICPMMVSNRDCSVVSVGSRICPSDIRGYGRHSMWIEAGWPCSFPAVPSGVCSVIGLFFCFGK